jgi:O-antigen ligase
MTQNTYGFLFSTFSPFLLVFILHYNGKKRFFSGLALLFLWAAAAINGSRGSWVAIGVGLIVLLLILLITQSQKFFGVIIGLSLLMGVAVVLFAGVPQLSDAVVNRFDTFSQLDQDKSYMVRIVMNQKSIRLFLDSPIIGIGPSRYRLTSIELDIPSLFRNISQSRFDAKNAHNSYLAYLAETGLIGGLPLSMLLIILLINGFVQVKWFVRQKQYWALAIYLSFIQMSVHMWVITSLYNSGTWFIYGLTGAMIMLVQSKNSNGEMKK